MSILNAVVLIVLGFLLVLLFLKHRQGAEWAKPLMAGLAILTLALSIGQMFSSTRQNNKFLNQYIRYQEIQGLYMGDKLAAAYPGAQVVLLMPAEMPGAPEIDLLPAPEESPPLILMNVWMENAEDLLAQTSVAGIVRMRSSLPAEAYKETPSNDVKEAFEKRFEYITLPPSA